jgi:hypothetical protein
MVRDCHRAGPTALWNDGALRHSQEAEGAEATKLLRERISKQALRLYVALPEHGPAVPIYLAGRRPELPRRRSPGRSRRIPSQLIESHCSDSGRSRLRLESGEAIGKRGRRWRMLLHTNHVAVRHSYRHDCRNAPFGARCWPGRRNRQATNVCCWHRCEGSKVPRFFVQLSRHRVYRVHGCRLAGRLANVTRTSTGQMGLYAATSRAGVPINWTTIFVTVLSPKNWVDCCQNITCVRSEPLSPANTLTRV